MTVLKSTLWFKTKPQFGIMSGAMLVVFTLAFFLWGQSEKSLIVFAIGTMMGATLYYGSVGFSGAYRQLLNERDMTGVVAQFIMLGLAIVLFAPVMAQGSVFGHGVSGSLAPVSVSVAFGAFLFGIGMQFARGCASGTLYTAGSGNGRMVLALVFFCIGAFWGSLDLYWWQSLPSFGVLSLPTMLGWKSAVMAQISALVLIYLVLKRAGWSVRPGGLWGQGLSRHTILQGPWPLIFAGIMLAVLNWATLLVTGHGWSITWAFSLWAAKSAVVLGWNPMTSSFWAGGFPSAALQSSVLNDETSVMNFGILLGAIIASSLAGYYAKGGPVKANPLIAAIGGGLLLGYGARLSYGCNIGAFFSGVASGSLHGWLWIVFALPGNALGLFLRRFFKL